MAREEAAPNRGAAAPVASLQAAILEPLAAAFLAVCVVGAGLAWLIVKDHLIEDQRAKALQTALATEQMAQTLANDDALNRLVQFTAADRAVREIVVVAGAPLMVVASSRAAWRGGALDRLPEDIRIDLLDLAGKGGGGGRDIVRSVKWFERQSAGAALPQPAAVLVDIDITRERHWIEAVALGAAASTLAVMLLLGGITHAVLKRKVIAPVSRISLAISRRNAGDAKARVPRLAGNELGSLASELNRALDAEDAARTAAVEREQVLRNALDELAASRARFEGLLASIPQHVWTADAGGWLDYVSPQTTAYFGVPATALLHGQWKDFLHPEDAANAHAVAGRSLHAGEAYTIDYRLRRHDGVYRWFSVTAFPLRDAGGRVVRWIGSNTDITERKRSEEQIQESQKLEAIGQLAGGLAHDFNNLLGIVVGNLDLMGERLGGDERLHAQHAAALDAALRGSEVTRALLAVARRQPLEVASGDVNALIEEMLPLLRTSAGQSVELLTQFTPGPIDARLDSAGLTNVVLNLVINARDALQGTAGPKRIVVRTRSVHVGPEEADGLAPGWYAVLEVADTGCGMSEAVVRQAFEPFFTTKPRGKGTGLGLSMVHGYAEQLGGTARIESAAGAGTTVRVFLPQAAEAAAGREAAEARRLAALRGHGILDTAPEAEYDIVVAEAATVCQAPIALVSLVDEHRQWFKARVGLQAAQTPREDAFCAHAVMQPREMLVVSDATRDPRFAGNPLVTGEPGVRFYAGVPLRDANGNALGTLCVIDRVPRTLTAPQLRRLETLATRIAGLIDERMTTTREPAAGAGEGAASGRPRVLVVDDEPGLCEVACDWLESLGYETVGVHSPARALAHLAAEPFDILFTDVVMPGDTDGLALAREAKRLNPALRVLLTSGYAQGLVHAEDLPGTLLTKPYRRGDLERAVRTLPR